MNKNIVARYRAILNYLTAILALIGGILLYLLFRTQEMAVYEWFSLSKLSKWADTLYTQFLFYSIWLPDWVIYSLPNGLWAFSYTLIITTLWRARESMLKRFWLLTIPLLVFGFELLQLIHAIPGTFCFVDLLFGGIGIGLGYVMGAVNNFIRK